MINYVKELVDTAKLDSNDVSNMVSFSCIGGKIVSINNYIKIVAYSPSRIVLKTKNDELIIEGDSISIRELNKRDISVSGNIIKIYFANEVRKYEMAK